MTRSNDCYLGARCRGPKYHVCLAGKEDTFPLLLKEIQTEKAKPLTHREEKVINAYRDGMSMATIAAKFLMGKQTVHGILNRAAEAGHVVIRPQNVVYASA